VYAVVDQILLPGTFPVSVVCDALRISRAGFYAWRSEEESARAQRDHELLPLVRDVFWKHKRRYGARRIAVELGSQGELCGVDRVAKLLKIQGLAAIQPKSFVPKTTQSRHGLGYSPNLLLHAPPPTRLDEVWVADITYIPLRTGDFAYLALVMDLFSRRVLGWDLAALMTETLVLEALRQAIGRRQPPPNLIHHSDRGGQYAGGAYRAVLRRAAMRQSMSRADECTDNAFMESCFGTIKTELEMTEYDHALHACAEIGPYLSYYNLERRHSSLGYVSPIQFEALNDAPN
jgi:transposase InsO family protein